jgi:hypothetical protein
MMKKPKKQVKTPPKRKPVVKPGVKKKAYKPY